MSATQQSPETMAKKQKTVHLPEDVFRLGKAHEFGTGIGFNRQVLASLFRLYFAPPDAIPDPWMQLAVRVEKGEVEVRDVPTEACKIMVEVAQARLDKNKYDPDANESEADRALRRNRIDLEEMEEWLSYWQERLATPVPEGTDPLRLVFEHLRRKPISRATYGGEPA